MLQTKQELINYFQGLEVATLQRLYKYASQIIIPDEDLLVNVTMPQMLNKAHQLADSLFPEWTDRSKSDFGEFLIELFAVFSEKDFWYINAFANEGIFSKTRSYGNAFAKASALGYQPTLLKGAKGTFKVIFKEGEATNYKRGDLVLNVGGILFTNDDEFLLPKQEDLITKTLILQQGEQKYEDYIFNGFNVFIRKENIDIDSVEVIINNIKYSRVGTFGHSGTSSTHFVALPEEDGSIAIYFGDGTLGVSPEIGTEVQVRYRVCEGEKGNVKNTDVGINESISSREAIRADMLGNASEGTDLETLSTLKEKAPSFFNTKRAAINEEMAEKMLNNFSFIKKSKVTVLSSNIGYRAIPMSGDLDLSTEELAILSREFDPYIMLGYNVSSQGNEYIDLITKANINATQLILDVLVYKGYDHNEIEGAVRQVLSDLTNPLVLANYGSRFDRADVDIKIRMAVQGVQGIVFKLLVGGQEVPMPDVELPPEQIFKPINQDKVNIRIYAS